MAAITVDNKPSDIIDELKATIEAATISAVTVFARCDESNSVERFKEKRLSGLDGKALACVVNDGVEEFIITDNQRGNVLSLTLVTFSQNTPEADNVLDATKLVVAIKNIVNTTKPTDSIAFYAEGADEITQRVSWGEPKSDPDSQKPGVFNEIPCFIAYTTTTETSH
jgi:hypothetical protein